jgi:hypothetical protein
VVELAKNILCCGVLHHEIEYLLKGGNTNVKTVNPGLHVDFKKMASAITSSLDEMGEDEAIVIIGNQCHPDMCNIISGHGRIIQAKNCIEMLLGDKMAQLESEARTFFMTVGWLENWQDIFVEGLKWDSIDARQNFGFYERILLLDTGVIPVDEEKVLEFYDYTQIPIEIMPISLDYFRDLLSQTLEPGRRS